MGSGNEGILDTNNPIILDAFLKCSQVFEQHEHALISISGEGQTLIACSTCASASGRRHR